MHDSLSAVEKLPCEQMEQLPEAAAAKYPAEQPRHEELASVA